jgi:hypothetical protein
MSTNCESQALRPSIAAPAFAGQRVKSTPHGVFHRHVRNDGYRLNRLRSDTSDADKEVVMCPPGIIRSGRTSYGHHRQLSPFCPGKVLVKFVNEKSD